MRDSRNFTACSRHDEADGNGNCHHCGQPVEWIDWDEEESA